MKFSLHIVMNVFIAGLMLNTCLPDHSHAQEAFSRIGLTVTAHKHLGNTDFTRKWNPGPGFGFEISTPYYAGSIEAGLRVVRFDEILFENSGFYTHMVFAGWRYRYATSDHLFLVPGIRLGNNFMRYDEDKIYGGEYRFTREESEFFYEVQLRIEYDISNSLGFYVSTSYNRTLFSIPFSAFYGTTGFSLLIETPNWLKRSLR